VRLAQGDMRRVLNVMQVRGCGGSICTTDKQSNSLPPFLQDGGPLIAFPQCCVVALNADLQMS